MQYNRNMIAHSDEVFQDFLAWLASNVNRPVSLREQAAFLGVSLATLHRHYARRTGLSPRAYFERLRHQEAMRLLATGHASIKEISWQLGYPDQYAFSRAFKRLEGIGPRAWRKEQRQKPEALESA